MDAYVGKKTPMHKETTIFVPFEHGDPAHYFCAILNSSLVTLVAKTYGVAGGKSFGSANLMSFVAIPPFKRSDPVHERLAALSQDGHDTPPTNEGPVGSAKITTEIDEATAELWGISPRDLGQAKQFLTEISQPVRS